MAQIVSLADVFDALTSSRIYKKAFFCDQAYTMIVKGECGAFSQIMLQCLMECLGDLKKIKAEYEDKNKQP